jgi:hypothetical protein
LAMIVAASGGWHRTLVKSWCEHLERGVCRLAVDGRQRCVGKI